MHTIETTLSGSGLAPATEAAESSGIFFGGRGQANTWHPQSAWVRKLFLAPPVAEKVEATPKKTTLAHDEVSAEAVGLSAGRVAIKVTDEQAAQIEKHHKGDAFPSH
jgi:Cu/Ag efflux protein CusF